MKPIRFSPHAEANLKAREIPRDEAEAAIHQPIRREPTHPPREMVSCVYFDIVAAEMILLRAVIEETEHEIVVVTLDKTSKMKKYLPEETT